MTKPHRLTQGLLAATAAIIVTCQGCPADQFDIDLFWLMVVAVVYGGLSFCCHNMRHVIWMGGVVVVLGHGFLAHLA